MKLLSTLLFSVSAQIMALRADTPDAQPQGDAGNHPAATVYFTSEISPESLVRIFDVLGVAPSSADKVAMKISTGEAGGHNFLRPSLISNLVAKVNGTIVECNTAYRGRRNSTEEHWKTIRDHGFTDIARVELLDERGEIEIPVRDRSHIGADLVGAGITNYTFMVNLAHFKGHQMGGFGGVLKNQSIGVASSRGKARIHSAGATDDPAKLWSKLPAQDDFLESMAAAAQGVHDHFGGGRIVYINVLNNLSVDCDCSSHPAAPKMKDLGIMASLDPVALDQASVDMVTGIPVSDGNDNRDLIARIAKRHGTHIIDHAERIGLGSRKYALVDIGRLDTTKDVTTAIGMTIDAAIGMVRRGEAECIVLGQGGDGKTLELVARRQGRGIAPLLDVHDSRNGSTKPFADLVIVDKIIGRAAAFIAISGGARAVHGEIMCEGAKLLLEKHGIMASCTLLVPQIRDRSYMHLCPLEDSVAGIEETDAAMKAIRARIAALRAKEKIETPKLPAPSRTLVAYYSRGGNTRLAAEAIAHATGADIFEIAPFVPYADKYADCLKTAKDDISANARPNLLPWPVDFSGYDIVFIGSPVWCGKVAPPVSTFLSVADLKGKKAIPFFTHGGGGADSALEDFKKRTATSGLPSAGVWKGPEVKSSRQAIGEWAARAR